MCAVRHPVGRSASFVSSLTYVPKVMVLCVVVVACQPDATALDPLVGDAVGVPTTTLHAGDVNDVPTLPLTLEANIPGNATHALLTRIQGLLITDAAEVTVPDAQAHIVRVFTRDGELLRQFGGRGDGPGELRRPFLIASFKDTVYVVDERGINVFAPDGRYLRRASIEMISNRKGRSYEQHFPQSIAIADGRAVISETPITMLMQSPDTAYQVYANLRLADLRTGALGEPIQQIPSPVYYPVVPAARWSARFGPEGSFVVRPDASVIVAGLEGRSLDVFVAGLRVRRIVFDVPRREVTRKELEAMTTIRHQRLKDMMENSSNTAYPANFLKTSVEGTKRLPFFKHHPAVGRIIASEEGRLLVNRPDLSAGGLGWASLRGKTVWNVFSGDFRAVGKVEFPEGFTPLAFHGDMVAGTSVDSLDVPSISGYRIGAIATAR